MTLLLWLAGVAVYLTLGVVCARRNLAASWIRARREWSNHEMYARRDVRTGYLTMLFLWPIRFPVGAVIKAANSEIDTGDPKVIERRMAQQQFDIAQRDRRIAELERDLGIGR